MKPPLELRIQHVFDAPKALVFKAWSEAQWVAKWFTPAPLTTPACTVELRTGGAFHLVMRMPEGQEFPMHATFTEVVPNERIVFSGNVHDDVTAVTTVTFTENNGKTTLEAHQVYSRESDATRGARAGWTQTLKQLANVVRTLR